MRLWALVPVKPLDQAKSRLAGTLAPGERAALVHTLLEDTLGVLRKVPAIGEIVVVTADPAVAAWASGREVRVLREAGGPDLNRGLLAATRLAQAEGAEAILILHADLPRLTAADVVAMVSTAAVAPVVVLAPDRHRRGTNALLCAPPGLIEYQFGPDSFALHCAQAQAVGARLEVCSNSGLALDLDTPEDLGLLRTERPGDTPARPPSAQEAQQPGSDRTGRHPVKMETYGDPYFMTDAQFQAELLRCEYCEEKPCMVACPCDCSPFDFIMAARGGQTSDLRRAAGEVMHKNPLGGVCGLVCPDTLCMAACSRRLFDGPIDIPWVQATVVQKAKTLGGIPRFAVSPPNGRKVAVIGGGPAGLAAAALLAQQGYTVDLFESSGRLGGMMALVPDHRLDKQVLATDIDFILSLGAITPHLNSRIDDPEKLLAQGYEAVCVAAGLWKPIQLRIENEDLAIKMVDLLSAPQNFHLNGRVAVIGGGATALDCAVTARLRGAEHVEMFMLETLAEMPLTAKERHELLAYDIEVSGRVRVQRIGKGDRGVAGIDTIKVALPPGQTFHPSRVKDVAGTEARREDVTAVIVAIGMKPGLPILVRAGLFYAGDMTNGPKTVVEASASGKNAAARIDAYLRKQNDPPIVKMTKSTVALPGFQPVPVSLETSFFGRPIRSPYLVSASPPSDGLAAMTKAYEAGWAGGVMKTAFDNVPIHIPSEYMVTFNPLTYGNCDNVSGHPLDRVCREVEQLVRQWPDRLTMASTGGPVTGHDDSDSAGWQSNTRKLEAAGAMGIEYSLSCPQGGDGTEGDIVSQNAELTAKIIDWIMAVGSADVPKLFKLTAAVTSIVPILRAIREVLARYPGKKAGITLANTFPTLAFRPAGDGRCWEEGVVVGMSGAAVTPISYFTLAKAVPEQIVISGNGGPMDYKAAMNFLALGVETVQFCTIVMKYGYGIIHELESGTAFLMQERGIRSMRELIGLTQPAPITDFMALSPVKKISEFNHALCVSCGNCTRCPYGAITLDEKWLPHSDPAKCVGCSICAKKCFTGAIYMRERTAHELEVLVEQ
jgi:2-phospho-L-lactate guanylyltransferase